MKAVPGEKPALSALTWGSSPGQPHALNISGPWSIPETGTKGVSHMDELSSAVDFRPRSRTLVIGGVPWLARITDKVRAKLRGTLGDYIYP